MTLLRRYRTLVILILMTLALTGLYALNRPESSKQYQSTRDAYVQADLTRVAAQVAGQIQRVVVEENQVVRAGDLLVEIDDSDIRTKLEEARAGMAQAAADIVSLQAQIARQDSRIQQAQAQLDADQAAVMLAQQERDRYLNLRTRGAGTVQSLQRAEAELAASRATLVGDQAAYSAAQQALEVLQANLAKAQATQNIAQARLDAAELALSHTRITAPVSGTVAQKVVRPGGYMKIGETLLTLVPLDNLYITANFRETQIARMRPGQPVSFTVDALPNITLAGRVESLGPASSVSFSAIQPHNASGNFTKIVQRLPVRIAVEPGQPNVGRLKVGMSVIPEVNTGNDRL